MPAPLHRVAAAVAAEGLTLVKAIPRSATQLGLELRRPDGGLLAGQWFADPAVYQQHLAAADPGRHHHVRPHRAHDLRQRGRRHDVDAGRHRQHLPGRYGDAFGVTAAFRSR